MSSVRNSQDQYVTHMVTNMLSVWSSRGPCHPYEALKTNMSSVRSYQDEYVTHIELSGPIYHRYGALLMNNISSLWSYLDQYVIRT